MTEAVDIATYCVFVSSYLHEQQDMQQILIEVTERPRHVCVQIWMFAYMYESIQDTQCNYSC